jgi:hypothetical protein
MRNKLISSLAGAAFILAASGSAFAATPKKKTPPPPPPPPAPVYSWTGWYVGGNVGCFDTQAEAEKWIEQHRWLTEQPQKPDVAPTAKVQFNDR